MPYAVRQNYGGCAGYAVVNTQTGRVMGCHPSRDRASAQVAALYANEPSARRSTSGDRPGSVPPSR